MSRICSSIKLTGSTKQEGKYFIASIDQLPISGFGTSDKEATDKMLACLNLYLQTHSKLGQTDQVINKYRLKTKIEYKAEKEKFEMQCPILA